MKSFLKLYSKHQQYNNNKSLYNQTKKNFSYVNNHGNILGSLVHQRHNNLRVISTPEFPVPYYQRISRNPPSREQITADFRGLFANVDQSTVIWTKDKLANSAEGLRVLDYVENRIKLTSYETKVSSVSLQTNIYTDDLLHYLDAAHEENCRILKNVDLSDVL